MWHSWLFLMLPTMLVLLLLLFQTRHTWDAQEGVVGVPVPDQQLLVWRNHLEREIKTGLLGGVMNIHSCTDSFRSTMAVPHFCETLLPPGTCQQSSTPSGRHRTAQDTAPKVVAQFSTIQHQHKPTPGSSPKLGRKQGDGQICSYRAWGQIWGLWSAGPRGPSSSGRPGQGRTQRRGEINHL